jgi:hypothetical protein
LKKSELRLNPPALNLLKKMVGAAAYGYESVKDLEGVKPDMHLSYRSPATCQTVRLFEASKGEPARA